MNQVHPKPRLVAEMNQMTVSSALEEFSASSAAPPVQLVRLFSVFSKNTYSSPVMLPIGLAYIAAIIEKAGFPVEVVDAVGEDIFRIVRTESGTCNRQGLSPAAIIDRINPETRVIGITMPFSQEGVEHRNCINAIREAHPGVTIVVGGEHPTAIPEYVLRDCPAIDYVVTGEGELTFLELMHRIDRGLSVDELQGVSYIDAEDRFVDAGLGRRIHDFNNLPRPAWHLFPVEKYFNSSWTMGISYGRNMPVLATRGCPFQCTFCSNPTMWTTRYVMRNPKEIVDEIEWLIEEYGTNNIDFADLTAIVKKDWVLAFCKELKARGIDIPWQLPSGTRSEALDDETVQAIFETGCRFLVYAPESGSAETLALIKKKVNLENLKKSVHFAIAAGHTVKINLVIAFPGESRRSMLQPVRFGIGMAFAGAHDCNVSIFAPYPGSELYDLLRSRGEIADLDDDYFNDLLVQFDFTRAQVYNDNIRPMEAVFYRVFCMAAFYLLSYTLRPARLFRLVSNVFKSRFQAANLFEQRIHDMVTRSAIR